MSVESRLARRLQRRQAPLPPHGVRARYQLGCHCLPCRLANAEYEVLYDRLARRQTRPGRALVDGKAARAWLRTMLTEGFTQAMIARELGTTPNAFRNGLRGRRMTWARYQALERLYRTRVAVPDGTCVTESPAAAVESRAE